jgi:hypothetical protein
VFLQTITELDNRTVDNSMAGAKQRLDAFYSYKKSRKQELVAGALALETRYNKLSIKLSVNKRPEYGPSGKTLQDVERNLLLKYFRVER